MAEAIAVFGLWRRLRFQRRHECCVIRQIQAAQRARQIKTVLKTKIEAVGFQCALVAQDQRDARRRRTVEGARQRRPANQCAVAIKRQARVQRGVVAAGNYVVNALREMVFSISIFQ